ncbi:Cytochrome P450 monooxygenase lolP1 [Colletotrichum siamense]|uniref:Cytochrome P450 monooxygenase lolP1 n=1 Tax=Colletotrichum siamense TaxID=690259 RepID=UPI001872322B|nr:Cytochrome P450 monooxygenase lolP1 [Colletotrichum siamense]KAF5500215.1 Cytochrome P450 monooxygenase lolP1 [Colletotrichum siamense]
MGLLSTVSSWATLPVLGGMICLYFIIDRLVVYLKFRHIPGPWWTGLSSSPHSKHIMGPRVHEWYAELSEKYGPIVRIAPGILITSSPDLWTHVNKNPAYKRTDWYYHACRVEYRRDNVFTQTDNAKHDARRKQMAPGYSGRENLDLEPTIDARLNDLLTLIRTKYISTESRIIPMDLAKKVQYFTLDVISDVGLGKTFGMLTADADVDGYLQSAEQGLTAASFALAFGLSWLAQAPVIGRFLAPSPADDNGFGRMIAACYRDVDARAARETDKKSDMLASFIRHGLSGDELRSEALEQIIAGSDTTAAAIRGTLLLIMTNARVYAKLQREIDDAVRDGIAPAKGEGLVSLEQTRRLPYLQAVIREALRVKTPVVNIFGRDVPAGGDTVDVGGESVYLPGGACIGYSAYAMHHSKETYGEDAKTFRPERWFEEDEEKLAAMKSVNDLVFGYGKFLCLGKPVAQIELAKTIFELFRNFELAPMDPARPWKAYNAMGLFFISDMWVQVMERK